ncbi:MAG TPA: hypothetical protein VHL11_12750 [Phototrophicaceae bacterium]|jgi:hypothetical protein|nr:hypothetical protein [Phototrophicaceae bacterium]
MPVDVTWGNPEKTYTCFRYTGKWTWEEYYHSIEAGYQLVKDVPYTVNILLDMTDCNLFPANILSHAGSSMRRPPRSFDLAVIATTSGFVHAIIGILNSFYGKNTKFKIVKSVEEAKMLFELYDQDKDRPKTSPTRARR